MSVSIECKKCGPLAMYNFDMSYNKVSSIVDSHKASHGRNHRVIVNREK